MKFRFPYVFAILLGCSSFVSAAVTFTVSFTPAAQSGLTNAEKAMFNDALAFWGNVITGYRDGVSRSWNLQVNTFSQAASGGGVLLGSAGPASLVYSGVVAGAATDNQRFIISTSGNANFNIHDDAGNLNILTLRHEIGHALGIGTLWEDNQVYNDGIAGNHNRTLTIGTPGNYYGAFGLAAYQTEFNALATTIPIELDGGSGTANGHWNEVADNIFSENQAGFDSQPGDNVAARTVQSGPNAGKSMDNELMTGMLSGDGFLSQTTIASLRDIGFTVVPEPSSSSVAILAGFSLIFLRRRNVKILG